MDNYSDFDMTTLTDLPDLAELDEVPLDILVGKFKKLQATDLSQSESL